jgi:GNAT superfamily N-acetyltransferase
MASMMWSRYVAERHGWETLERDGGFITYDLKPPECSIEEFYVEPKSRGTRLAKDMADEVFRIAHKAGALRMWARVIPGTNGAEHAMKTNLHYGFKIACTRGNDIILVKAIGE